MTFQTVCCLRLKAGKYKCSYLVTYVTCNITITLAPPPNKYIANLGQIVSDNNMDNTDSIYELINAVSNGNISSTLNDVPFSHTTKCYR